MLAVLGWSAAGIAWFVLFVFLFGRWMDSNGRDSILYALAELVIFVVPAALLIYYMVQSENEYAQRCHDAGGIVLDGYLSQNCVKSDGKYLDVR